MTFVSNFARTGSRAIKWAGVVASLSLTFMAGLVSTNQAFAANILGNPGFETGNFTNWTAFGPNNSVINTGGYAHSGSYYYKVYGQFVSVTPSTY